MKNLFKATLVAAGILSFGSTYAQTHKDSTLGHKINRTAKKIGNKTAQIGATGAAAVVDKKYAGKMGPDGQTIYINKNAHYYYVNKTGHRVYLTKAELKNKPSE